MAVLMKTMPLFQAGQKDFKVKVEDGLRMEYRGVFFNFNHLHSWK